MESLADNKDEPVILREYIYNGESEEELKTRLKNIFGDGCMCERYKYDSVKPPIGTIYVYDEFNYGWVAGKAAFCGWNFVVVGKNLYAAA